MSPRADGLPEPEDTRDIVDDSGPIPGRLAAWADEGDGILGLCPVHGGWGKNVGQHIPGFIKMCSECARKHREQQSAAPGNPLNM